VVVNLPVTNITAELIQEKINAVLIVKGRSKLQ
jgi:hypothetical protein